MSEGVINRNKNYNGADHSLRQPLTSLPHQSSKSNLLPNDPRSSSSSFQQDGQNNVAYNSNAAAATSGVPQSVNWLHTDHSTFSQIAHNDPVDPNVVIVPKHPTYLSKLYRPDAKTIASEEGFATLRVETLALCCLFIVTAAVFSPQYAPLIILLCIAGVLCLIGFLGALRQIKSLIYLYIAGLIVWVLIVVTLAFTILFIGDNMKDDATERCFLNKPYFMKFGETPFGMINCEMNAYQCFQRCITEVKQHLRISYFVFGGLICIFLTVYFFRMININKTLIFLVKIEPIGEEPSNSDNLDDDDDEDEIQINSNGLQQGRASGNGVQLVPPAMIGTSSQTISRSDNQNHHNVRFSSRVDGDDLILTTQNPLNSG